ncbi:PcfJ domain-containing protein [Shewanella sp. 10N.286.48.B5]|uniref:PcfJ domain-containing protein n=1 Tax=Shewanella sp. 10N.286.48.B5 TaxID=1880834 RepID=UPI000C82B24D|nr:PcfJ domain-containing protein [Shewanella sp. 10N.286.48.B5]PMH85261.1 hypothetical protein BCU57_14740 [Shewanella sp. 10N.286.48.B5]
MFTVKLVIREELLLDTEECNGNRYRVVFKSWDENLSWSVAVNDEKFEPQSTPPGINLAACLADNELSIGWWNELSSAFKSNVLQFSDESAYVLQLASEHKGIYDLVAVRPALLALLFFNINGHEALIATASKPQRDILQILGMPESKRSLKVLSKYSCERFDRSSMDRLLEFLRSNPDSDAFQHEAYITDVTVRVANAHPWLISTVLWRGVRNLQKVKRKSFISLIDDCLMLASALSIGNEKRVISSLKGLEELQALHERWVTRVNAKSIEDIPVEEYDTPFHFFPLPDVDGIEAIRNRGELSVEGITLAHCISSYFERIQLGSYCAYRVTKPQRATIGFRVDADGNITLDQVRGYKNAKVNKETSDFITTWIKRGKYEQ